MREVRLGLHGEREGHMPPCVEGDCGWYVSWRSEDSCSHECLYQARYGRPEDIGYITPDDW
jgi:hypothetical protein